MRPHLRGQVLAQVHCGVCATAFAGLYTVCNPTVTRSLKTSGA
jgi:hypothetical protein